MDEVKNNSEHNLSENNEHLHEVSKKSLLTRISPLVTKARLLAVVVMVAIIGTILLVKPMASSPYGVTRAADELALQFMRAHGHGIEPGTHAPFHPPGLMLYGNGLLLCGDEHPSPKIGFQIKSGQLSTEQIDEVIERINTNEPYGADEKQHSASIRGVLPIEAVDQIIIGYSQGSVQIFGDEKTRTQGFKNIEAVINSTCQKYAKTSYDPEKYILHSVPVSEESVTNLDEVSSTLAPPAPEGESNQATISRDEAVTIKKMNKGNNYAKLKSGDKTYQMELVPVIPEYKPISSAKPANNNRVAAASSLPSRWFWVYPSDVALSSTNTEAATISSKVRAFYKQETVRDNSAASVVIIRANHPTSWYQNTCTSYGCLSDKDHQAFANLREEMTARNYLPDGTAAEPMKASYNFMFQGPSSKGLNWCYGWGDIPGNPYTSRGGVGITFGFGSTSRACQLSAYPSVHYLTVAHEFGHTLGLQHLCTTSFESIMDNCGNTNYTLSWPTAFHVGSTQKSELKAGSLFFNHLVSGRVYYSGTTTGVGNITISTCNTNDASGVTNSTGYFGFRFPTRSGYCLRMTAPAGYTIQTKNNPENPSARSYESQLAGYNCYKQAVSTSCNSNQVAWDMASDSAKDFVLVKQ